MFGSQACRVIGPTSSQNRWAITVGAMLQKPLRPGQGPGVSVGFLGFGCFLFGFRPCFLPPGPIVESAFLWRCFRWQKPPCSQYCHCACCATAVMRRVVPISEDLSGSGSLLLLHPVWPPARFLFGVANSSSPLCGNPCFIQE